MSYQIMQKKQIGDHIIAEGIEKVEWGKKLTVLFGTEGKGWREIFISKEKRLQIFVKMPLRVNIWQLKVWNK